MDLISWSLSAIDTIFSKRPQGSGEPKCPGGSSPAGYTMDAYEKWRVVCLTELSVEDVEDIFIMGFMITGFVLIGLGIFLGYRQITKAVAAVKGPFKLPHLIDVMGRAVGGQSETLKRVEAELAALRRTVDRMDQQIGKGKDIERHLDERENLNGWRGRERDFASGV